MELRRVGKVFNTLWMEFLHNKHRLTAVCVFEVYTAHQE